MKKFSSLLLLLSFSFLLFACSNNEKEVDKLLKETRSNMVYIKGGSFDMGSGSSRHKVTLTPFYMSKYNVSYRDYDTYTKATGKSLIRKDSIVNGNVSLIRDSSHPAKVSWFQAEEYVKWLRKRTGLKYDLPTEAQWEYAARNLGKEGWNYPTNNGKLEIDRNFPSDKMRRDQKGNTYHIGEITMPIGSLPVNPLGLYGMTGQVGQWCKGWYSNDYYSNLPGTTTDPQGAESGTERPVRGMGVTLDSALLSNYVSEGIPPSQTNIGFRLVINQGKL